ncbi:MAG: SIMPL domain-containing protein [Vicinamibacterales bacterium]
MRPITAALVTLVFLATPAGAQTATAEPPTVVTSGEGVVTAVPDQAWVRIGAESRSKVPKEAQARNAEAMTAVQQKIAALGIPKDAVRTVAIDLQMEYDYANGRQTPRGYVARNTIEVRVDEFAKLGDVLDAAVGSGATNLHGLRFDVKRREALEREAMQLAVANAVGRAEALAAGAKRSIDRVIRIEESFSGRGGEVPVMAMRMKAEDASTPVAAGELEIRAQVRLTAALK